MLEIKNLFEDSVISQQLSLLDDKATENRDIHDFSDFQEVLRTLEHYNAKKVTALYNYLTDLALYNPNDESVKKALSCISNVANFSKEKPYSLENGIFKRDISYGFLTKHKVGRLYGFDSSLQSLSREVRYYLFKEHYNDLDLENAHPTILLDYAISRNIKTPVLKQIVYNREKFFRQLHASSKKYKCSVKDARDDMKIEIISTLNLTKIDSNRTTLPLKLLHEEVLLIRNALWDEYYLKGTLYSGYVTQRKSFEKRGSLEKQKVTIQTYYCFTKESELVLKLFDFLSEYAKDKNLILSFIPFFDGAYVRFDINSVFANSCENIFARSIAELVEELNKKILPLKFKIKPIEPNWKTLDPEALVDYMKIDEFLNEIDSMSMFIRLLKYLNLSFELKPSTLQLIKLSSKKDMSLLLRDSTVSKEIKRESSVFMYELRKSLRSYCRDFRPLRELLRDKDTK